MKLIPERRCQLVPAMTRVLDLAQRYSVTCFKSIVTCPFSGMNFAHSTTLTLC